MNAKQKAAFIQKHLGDANQIADELLRFRKSALVLSRSRPRMIEEHPQEWVAVYDGKVRATDKSFKKLLHKIDADHIPRGEVLIRFIDRTQRTLIL